MWAGTKVDRGIRLRYGGNISFDLDLTTRYKISNRPHRIRVSKLGIRLTTILHSNVIYYEFNNGELANLGNVRSPYCRVMLHEDPINCLGALQLVPEIIVRPSSWNRDLVLTLNIFAILCGHRNGLGRLEYLSRGNQNLQQ
jgi:hypothetical protein